MEEPATVAQPKPADKNGAKLVTKDALVSFMQASLTTFLAPDRVKAAVNAGVKAMAGKLATAAPPASGTEKKKKAPSTRKIMMHNMLVAGGYSALKAQEEHMDPSQRIPHKEAMAHIQGLLKAMPEDQKQKLIDRYTPLLDRLNERGEDEKKANIQEEMIKFEQENKLPPFSFGPALKGAKALPSPVKVSLPALWRLCWPIRLTTAALSPS